MSDADPRKTDRGGDALRPISLPTSRRSLKRSELIAQELANYIVDSQLPSGSVLPREKDMVEQLGVGRNTLREALRLLESRGVVTMRSGPGGGPVVRHPEPSDLREGLTLILQFQRATMNEVMDARTWLEPSAARLAASNITKAEVLQLRRVNAEMSEHIDSHETIMDTNRRFHQIIAAATGNLVVQVFTETLLTVADSGVGELNHSTKFRKVAVEGHEEIIDAMAARDPDAAEAAMRKHVTEGKNRRSSENPDIMARALRWVQ